MPWGIVVGAVIGAGSAYYQSEEAKKTASAQEKRLEEERAKAQAEADRIARDTKPQEQALEEITFGTDDKEDTGATTDFIVPKVSSLGGSNDGLSGLGFKV